MITIPCEVRDNRFTEVRHPSPCISLDKSNKDKKDRNDVNNAWKAVAEVVGLEDGKAACLMIPWLPEVRLIV